MEQKKTRKIAFTRAEFAKKEKRTFLLQGALLDILTIAITLFAILYTIGISTMFDVIPLGFCLFMLFIALCLLAVSVSLIVAAIKTNLPLFCLMLGKYKVEVDRVQQIELRSERNKEQSNSLIQALTKPENVTWQYVRFEHNGKIKIEPQRRVVQDAEYYVLVSLGKKPHVLNFRSCEKYELIDPEEQETPVQEDAPAQEDTPVQEDAPVQA